MNIETQEIIEFIKELSGNRNVLPDSDIFGEIGLTGDDFHEMIDKFSKKYSVNMDEYLWYFHADEEGQNFGSIFFKPPYKSVTRIPITPQILSRIASLGKWDIKYPVHDLPKKRNDLIFNRELVTIFIVALIIWIIIKWIN